MILKKPFAFLIKNFRKIHLVITLLMIFSSYMLLKIYSFFSGLVTSADVTSVPNNLLSIYLLLSIVILLVFSVFMYVLMRKKEKPTKFYFFMIVYYILLLILFFVASSVLKDIDGINILSLETKRAYRDVASIFSYPQYVLLLYCLFRTIGFDIKKFNFGKDLRELEISQADNEEFEFVLGFDFSKILLKLRKNMRELRYYFLENTKIFFIIILSIVAVIGGVIGYNAIFGKRVYSEAETITAGGLKVVVLKSYISNLSQNGEIINQDKYYFIVNLKINSSYAKDTALNISDFKIISGENYYLPDLTKNNFFVDLGRPYNNEKLSSNTDYSYLLIYEIGNNDISDDYQLKISGGYTLNNSGEQDFIYKYINLKPTIIENVKKVSEIAYNAASTDNILSFEESVLGEAYLKFKSFEIAPVFQYKYNKCYSDTECYDLVGIYAANSMSFNSTLLVLDATLFLNTTSLYSLNNFNVIQFFNNFASIKYTNGTSVSKVDLVIKNTSEYTEKMVFEIPQSAATANSLSLTITIRNKQYVINLK